MKALAASGSDHPADRTRGVATSETSAPGPAEGELAAVLTVDEVASLLRVERKTVYAAIQRGEIPGVRRVGSLLRISRDAVLEWLSQGQGRVSRSRRSA